MKRLPPKMQRLVPIFWNAREHRLRSLWRLSLFLLMVAAVANPLILWLDATDNRFLEASFENFFVAVACVVAISISARFIDRTALSQFGLSCLKSVWWIELGQGLAIGGVIMGIAIAGQYLAGWMVVEDTVHTTFTSVPFVIGFAGQLIRYLSGSFFEELLSRSYLLRLTAENVRSLGVSRTAATLVAAVLMALVFGLLHLFNPESTLLGIINLILLGLLFAVPMVMTGRLAMSIGLHAGWNIVQNNVFGLPNGGKPSHASLVVSEAVGPDMMTGGAFGPEGGFVSSIAILLGLILVGGWLGWRGKRFQFDVSLPARRGD